AARARGKTAAVFPSPVPADRQRREEKGAIRDVPEASRLRDRAGYDRQLRLDVCARVRARAAARRHAGRPRDSTVILRIYGHGGWVLRAPIAADRRTGDPADSAITRERAQRRELRFRGRHIAAPRLRVHFTRASARRSRLSPARPVQRSRRHYLAAPLGDRRRHAGEHVRRRTGGTEARRGIQMTTPDRTYDALSSKDQNCPLPTPSSRKRASVSSRAP